MLSLLLALTISTALAPVAVYAQQIGANTTTTNTTNGSGADAAPAPGEAIPASCQDIRENPTGQGPNYRVVRGSCEIRVEGGTVLSNVWFRGGGEMVHINARGAGWTIRNVAITNSKQNGNALIDAQVNSPNGSGLIHNVYIANITGPDANAVFVNSRHAGAITIRQSTFLNIYEDALYGSPPGNLHVGWGKEPGKGGTVHVVGSYAKNVGIGPEQGYGFRLGSDGSSITNSVIVGADVGVANLFAVGSGPSMKPGVTPGVTMRRVVIARSELGVRLGSHQGRFQRIINRQSITTMQQVAIDATEAVDRNLDARIRGGYSSGGSPTPPAGVPRSPERAASGIGGGTGSIGGLVTGPGGLGGFISQIASFVAIGVVSIVLALVAIAVGAIALLERDGDGNGGNGGFP